MDTTTEVLVEFKGYVLKGLRCRASMTRIQLAKLVRADGQDYPNAHTVERWEEGSEMPDAECVGRLADEFSVLPVRLLRVHHDVVELPRAVLLGVCRALRDENHEGALGMLEGALVMAGESEDVEAVDDA